MNRRDWIRSAAALPWAGAALAHGEAAARDQPGTIVRQYEPRNQESPFSGLDGPITPTERFFVRSHFPTPRIDPAGYRLKVEGRVRQPLELSLDDLAGLPGSSMTALLECAGNGRVFLSPRADGLLWGGGAVGVAEWRGALLRTVLEHAGIAPDAVEVILEGADEGQTAAEPRTPGVIRYARSVPLAKATSDVLLATEMNGRPLTPEHGWPLRAVVPGWYGMASVKWLSRIVAVDRPFGGFYQTLDYAYFERRDGQPSLVPVTEVQVKSQIARPSWGESLERGSDYAVRGAAWSGGTNIAKVEISADGGATWAEAELEEEGSEWTWRLWKYTWRVPGEPGPRRLMARATDGLGHMQPSTRDIDRRSYMINHVIPVEVIVG